MAADSPMRTDDMLWLLGSLCRIARVPFDAALVAQRFPPPNDRGTLREAAQALGFKTGRLATSKADPAILPLPCIGFTQRHDAVPRDPAARRAHLHLIEAGETSRSDSTAVDDAGTATDDIRPALLLRIEDGRLVYFCAGTEAPQSINLDELGAAFESPLILVTLADGAADLPAQADTPALVDADPVDTAPRRFGLRWFVPELLRHKRIWQDVLLASVSLQLVGLAAPLFTQVLIDKVVVHRTESTLVVVASALAMFTVFTAVMTWLRQHLVLHTGNRIDAVLGSRIFSHLLRLPLAFFEQRTTGVLVARLQGIETIRQFVSGAAVSLLLDLPFLLIFLAVMFHYSWQLSLIALALLALIAALSVGVVPVMRERLNRQFMLGARNQSFVTEYVGGIATVKSLQMEPYLEKKYGDYLAAYLGAGFSTRRISNTYSVAANALEQAMTLAILIVGALLVMRSDGFTVGMLVAFQMFTSRMSQPLLRLVGLWQEFQQANVAVQRLGDLMNAPTEPYAMSPSRAASASAGRIELHDVSFRYSPHHPYLYRDLRLTLVPGGLHLLTGPSGSGKSTLAKLLLGFYAPTEGEIRLDGRDLRHLAANELRLAFGVVPQETVLFAGTVYDNLIMAHPHAGFDDVIAACRFAEIHDTIEKLPQGYRTAIGEHGIGLSGGQRQRLAIARALLKKPKFLIFDEAVSNLDQPTAEHFAQTVNRLKGKVTMLFITHHVPRGLMVDQTLTLNGASVHPAAFGH
jgi:subfamily B ATP-binding cassette protein HlyB/CyaB